MNIAFSALVIILLVVPGATFLWVYRSGALGLPTATTSFQENIVAYTLLAIPLHGVSSLIALFFGSVLQAVPTISLVPLADILISREPSAETIVSFSTYAPWMLTYVLFSVLAASIIALVVRSLVRALYLDLIYPLIKPNSYWHYFFTGEQQAVLDAQRVNSFKEKQRQVILRIAKLRHTKFVFVSFVLQHGSRAYLYWGALADYKVRGDQLVEVTLEKAQRRFLEEDDPAAISPGNQRVLPSESNRFYPIRGKYIAFDAKHISSLNLDFYRQPPSGLTKRVTHD